MDLYGNINGEALSLQLVSGFIYIASLLSIKEIWHYIDCWFCHVYLWSISLAMFQQIDSEAHLGWYDMVWIIRHYYIGDGCIL